MLVSKDELDSSNKISFLNKNLFWGLFHLFHDRISWSEQWEIHVISSWRNISRNDRSIHSINNPVESGVSQGIYFFYWFLLIGSKTFLEWIIQLEGWIEKSLFIGSTSSFLWREWIFLSKDHKKMGPDLLRE